MRWSARTLSLALVLTGAVVSPSAPASAAAGDRIDVAFRTGQVLAGIDPERVAVRAGFASTDCAAGCELWRVGSLRFNYEEVQVAAATFPARSSPRTVTVDDVLERTRGLSLDWHYELRKGDDVATVWRDADPTFVPDTGLTYGPGWRREVDLKATETMVARSTTRGATATRPASSQPAVVGVVAARGPGSGVMAVTVDGVVQRTLDLQAATRQPRRVVASVAVPAGARLQVVNATPDGRTGRDVHVDGLVTLPAGSTSAGAAAPAPRQASEPAAAAAATGPSLTVLPAEQPLPTSGGVPVTVTARVPGCPSGCSIVEQSDTGDRVLLQRTSPASSTLQTLTVTAPAPAFASYRLVQGTATVASTGTYEPVVRPDADLTYSAGWVRAADAASTGGTVMRTSTPGAGATYRVSGTFEGRPVGLVAAKGPQGGIAAVYADGVLVRTVDLYAPTRRARQVVAALPLPLTGRITVVDRTPASRAGKDVHVDGLVVLEATDDWY